MWAKQKAFTVVELLIVMVVIGVLATVSTVAYRGVQERARDSRRMADIKAIDEAIDQYITDKRHAPDFNGACSYATTGGNDANCFTNDMNGGTSYTWQSLATELQPYIKSLPKDPCGLACYNKRVANFYSDGFFVYRYSAPGSIPDGAATVGPLEENYAIVAQNLESKTASYGFGFGSF